jgi:hypothetical protein
LSSLLSFAEELPQSHLPPTVVLKLNIRIVYYVIRPKLLLTNIFYFQQTSGIHAPVGKRKGGSLSGRSPAHIAGSSNVATIAREQRVDFTRN